MLNTQVPAFYRFKIGTIEATVVSDGPLPIGPATRTFRGPSEAELGQLFAEHFLPTDNVVLDQNCLVINTGDQLVLFDTGMASVKRPGTQTGRLLTSLQQANIDPKDIDAVVLTHPHIDHSGGMVADDGSRNFPNAQVYMTQADFDFWMDDKRLGTAAEGSAVTARKNLPPYRDRIVFIKDGQEILPGVQAMQTPGHTVGHTVYMITSGGKTICNIGDVAHHVVLFERPRIEVAFDTEFEARRGVEGQAVRHAGRAAHPADGLPYALARDRPTCQIGRRFPLRADADAARSVAFARVGRDADRYARRHGARRARKIRVGLGAFASVD